MNKKDISARSDKLKSDDQKYRRKGTSWDVRLDVFMDMADKKIGADRVVTSPPNRRKE